MNAAYQGRKEEQETKTFKDPGVYANKLVEDMIWFHLYATRENRDSPASEATDIEKFNACARILAGMKRENSDVVDEYYFIDYAIRHTKYFTDNPNCLEDMRGRVEQGIKNWRSIFQARIQQERGA